MDKRPSITTYFYSCECIHFMYMENSKLIYINNQAMEILFKLYIDYNYE